jgi:hypothetical protein
MVDSNNIQGNSSNSASGEQAVKDPWAVTIIHNGDGGGDKQPPTVPPVEIISGEKRPTVELAKGGVWQLPAIALMIAMVFTVVLLPLGALATGSGSVTGRVLVTPLVIGSIALSLFSVLQGISRIANGPIMAKSAGSWLQSPQSVPFETAVAGLALLVSFATWGWVFRDLLAADHRVFSERPEAAIYWSNRLLPVWIPLLAGMFAMLVNQVSLWSNGVVVKKADGGPIISPDLNGVNPVHLANVKDQPNARNPTSTKHNVTL